MKINNEHLYHGAALNQIAEDPHFTTINAFKIGGTISRSAFRINDSIGVYLKYSSGPVGRFDEYKFTFNKEHLAELQKLSRKGDKTFLALVCVEDGHICCLGYDDLQRLINERKAAVDGDEDQYQILVVLEEGKRFQVYINRPNVKGKMLGKMRVPRNAFPSQLFG